jgi:tetratricopeptide (TPR) repeat protein
MKLGIAATVLAACCALPPAAIAEHDHPEPEKLGTVHFENSCAPAVQPAFERAVALLHSFAYAAADRAFRGVAAGDPTCAMAHWGIAMAHYHELWAPPDAEEFRDGAAEAAEARSIGAPTARERAFIAAIVAFYADPGTQPHRARAMAYEQAMALLAAGSPGDPEAQIFYALALLSTAPLADRAHTQQKHALAILEPYYRSIPDHPGVAHYLIHACDSAELAARGLDAARAYSKIAPSAPHALHMPSHTFTRLGLWQDSIDSNRAARAAAIAQGDIGEELHSMDYLTYAYLQSGRDADARRVVADLSAMGADLGADPKVGYAATAMPVRLAMERHDWHGASQLEARPRSDPGDAAIVYWARAVAASRGGHAPAAAADIDRLNASQRELKAAGREYPAALAAVLAQEAQAWQAFAAGRSEEALGLLGAAADNEDAVEKSPATPGPIVPAREQLGELYLELGRPADARRAFETALAGAPGRRGAFKGLERVARATHDPKLAARTRAALGS